MPWRVWARPPRCGGRGEPRGSAGALADRPGSARRNRVKSRAPLRLRPSSGLSVRGGIFYLSQDLVLRGGIFYLSQAPVLV